MKLGPLKQTEVGNGVSYYCMLQRKPSYQTYSANASKIYAPSRVLLSPALSPTCSSRPLFVTTRVFTARATVQEL